MTIQFSKDHEWVNAADTAAAVVGITIHAQDALGDVVFVELPDVGASSGVAATGLSLQEFVTHLVPTSIAGPPSAVASAMRVSCTIAAACSAGFSTRSSGG